MMHKLPIKVSIKFAIKESERSADILVRRRASRRPLGQKAPTQSGLPFPNYFGFFYPEGISSSSPGLRQLPWVTNANGFSTRNGLRQSLIANLIETFIESFVAFSVERHKQPIKVSIKDAIKETGRDSYSNVG